MLFETLLIIGFLNSVYSLYVIQNLDKDLYTPLCDFTESIKCSTALSSEQSHLFGIPNPVLGIGFYPLLFITSLFSLEITLVLIVLSIAVSIYLAYQLYTLRTICPVCILSYIINVLLFFTI